MVGDRPLRTHLPGGKRWWEIAPHRSYEKATILRSWLFLSFSLLRGAQRKIVPRRATQFLPLLLQR